MPDPIVDVLPASPPAPFRIGASRWVLDSAGHRWKVKMVCEVEYSGSVAEERVVEKAACHRFDDMPLLLTTADLIARQIRNTLEIMPICSCGQPHEEPTT
jgi:hypothetical protein